MLANRRNISAIEEIRAKIADISGEGLSLDLGFKSLICSLLTNFSPVLSTHYLKIKIVLVLFRLITMYIKQNVRLNSGDLNDKSNC